MGVTLFHPNDRSALKADYEEVSAWTRATDQMPDHSVEALMGYPLSVLAYDHGANVLGHVALTRITGSDGNKIGLIGALIVHPDCRQQHLGEALVQHLVDIVGGVRPDINGLTAWANEASVQLFTKLGGLAFKDDARDGPCNYAVSVPMGLGMPSS